MSPTAYQNPFASSHSLDTNPFDDPAPPQSSSHAAEAARLEELRRREQDLERREQELTQKAEHIRKHGRNNWPPCMPFAALRIRRLIAVAALSLPIDIPLNTGRNPRGLASTRDAFVPTLAGSGPNFNFEHGCLYLRSVGWLLGRRERSRRKHWVSTVTIRLPPDMTLCS